MRNLKRALSLALASVMLLGMMVVGTSASYPDVKATDNEEAIAVMQLLKIMEGDDKGNFNPAKAVTRNEMAVIMTKLLDLNTKDYAGSCPFTDVPAWAEPYVAACYANKIVSGTSATTYGGDQTVTTAQAALMVLKALGYFQYAADFGEDWMVSTVKQASKISLFDGLTTNANAALTRNDVAQLALNALEADVVETDGNGGTTIKGDGFEISTGAAKYEKVEKKGFDYQGRSDADDGYQQLVEKLFGKDVVKTTDDDKKNPAVDDFGRPATKWENKDKDVKDSITVANEAVAVYAGEDYDKDVTDDLKDDYDNGITKVVYNGGSDSKVTVAFLEKGIEGLTIEIYEDPKDDDGLIAVVTEGYVAQIDDIKTNDKDEVTNVTFTVYEAGVSVSAKKLTGIPFDVDVDKDDDAYAMIEGLEEDDYFIAFLKPGWDVSKKASDLLAVDSVESVEGKVTALSDKGNYTGWLKLDGTKYTFANEYSQAEVKVDSEGTFYLYNGYVVHFDGEINKADDEYLYVVRGGDESDKFGGKTYYAEVVFTDGTSKTIEVAKVGGKAPAADVAGGLYSYTYSEKDDNYKLTSVDSKGTPVKLEKGKTSIATGITGNAKTIYVSVKLDGKKFDSATVYTGYKSVKSMTGTGYIDTTKGTAEVVFILSAVSTADNSDLIYVAGKSVSGKISDTDLDDYYTYNAVVDGEIVEIMVDAAVGNKLDGLYNESVTNDKDVYTTLKNNSVKATTVDSANFKKAADEVIKIEDTSKNPAETASLAYADDVAVYVIDTDGDITTGSINRNYSNVSITYTTNDDGEVTNLYIVKK